MVGRFTQLTPAMVVDLDGTYLSCNSFSRFIAAAVRNPACRLPYLWYALLRKSRLISHATMKRRMLRVASRHLSGGFMERFAASLLPCRNEYVGSLMARFDGPKILATAAPACYAEPLARLGGFDFCVATPMPVDDSWHETRGEAKLAAVRQLLQHHGLSLHTVITDHPDDTPLLQAGAVRSIML